MRILFIIFHKDSLRYGIAILSSISEHLRIHKPPLFPLCFLSHSFPNSFSCFQFQPKRLVIYSTTKTLSTVFLASAVGSHFWHASPDPCRTEIIIEAIEAKPNRPAPSVPLIFHLVYMNFIAFLSNTDSWGFPCLIWSKTTVTDFGLTVVETETASAGAAETFKHNPLQQGVYWQPTCAAEIKVCLMVLLYIGVNQQQCTLIKEHWSTDRKESLFEKCAEGNGQYALYLRTAWNRRFFVSFGNMNFYDRRGDDSTVKANWEQTLLTPTRSTSGQQSCCRRPSIVQRDLKASDPIGTICAFKHTGHLIPSSALQT